MAEQPDGPDAGRPDPLEEAVAKARAGEGQAFDEIYRVLSGPVFSYLASQTRRREDAEDLTGQVFLEAMRGIRGFTGDASAFRGWLFRIAHNRAVDLGRRLSRRPEGGLEEAESLPDRLGTEERAIAGVIVDRLWKAVEALPEQQRRVLILRLGAGLSAREIAQALDKRIGTVKALQHRALTGLAKALDDLGDVTDRPRRTL
ncbi:MAG: RNA polymerase sigma factor [Actinomycetota bacterium]